jgi:polyisoprenoid-binding protein YceI
VTAIAGTVAEQGQEVRFPDSGTWVIDPAHSRIGFVARYMMVTKVRGHFGDLEGAIHVAEDPSQSWAEATFKTASIDTSDATRDGHLRSPDFLDVERYPEITFRSTSVRVAEDGSLELTGRLTIRDVTRPVMLRGEYVGLGSDPFGNQRAMFSLAGELDREDFGITWNKGLETGGVLVGKTVELEIEVSAIAS